ncbi:MAG: hypothetical protein ACJ71T_03180 [Actinomycetales bacterium]
MSAVRRVWLSNHATAGAGFGLVGLMLLTWAVTQGVIEDRLTNPLGDSYASLSVTLILPVLAISLLPVVLNDQVDPAVALAARPLGRLRAAWWLFAVVVVFVALQPVQGLIGATQLRIDIGLLAGLSTVALCTLGLGPASTVPLVVLLPHLARRTGAPLRWWTVLSTAYPSATEAVAAALAVGGLVTYAVFGPRAESRPTGGGAD